MTFSRAKPAGWGTGEILTSTQANTIDLNQSRAIDGNAGGSYTPSAAIDITGANGLGDIDITGNAAFASSGTVSFGGDVTWTGATNLPKLGSRSYTYVQTLNPTSNNAAWVASSVLQWATNNNASPYSIYFYLDNLPYLSTLTSVTAWVQGKSGHAGLPAVMPNLSVTRRLVNAGASVTALGNQDDTSANTTAYQAIHAITVSGLSQTVDGTLVLYALLQAESGANALDSFTLYALTATCTVTQIAP